MQIGPALRLLRTRRGVSQTEACNREGAPSWRSLSQWETGQKVPSLRLLSCYLRSQDLDLYDLQEAIDQVAGRPPRQFRDALSGLEQRVEEIEAQLTRLEDRVAASEKRGSNPRTKRPRDHRPPDMRSASGSNAPDRHPVQG